MEACKLDQETAKALLVEGGTLVFLGVPAGTQFGVDMQCWSTDEHFRGVKMIPPGLHYVHYAAAGSASGDVAPRSGFMHYFKKKEFVVKLWDKEKEDLSSDEVSEESVQRLQDNLLSLDRHLGPYPYDSWPRWKQLTSHITAEIAERLSPESGIIRSSVELMPITDADRPRGVKRGEDTAAAAPETSGQADAKRPRRLTREEKEEAMLPNLKPVPGAALRLRAAALAPAGCPAAELTRHCRDRSYTLRLLLARHERPLDIIGELQFAYVCFLIGHSLDAFEHWKELVVVLCSCDEAMQQHAPVFAQFVRALQVQLQEMPPEFLADIVMDENLVYRKLREFFRRVRGGAVESRLLDAAGRLQEALTATLQWDFSGLDEEDEDERPVLVSLPPGTDSGGDQ